MKNDTERLAVIGLGYVGLPVAVALAGAFEHVVGFDISQARIAALQAGIDVTGEIESADLTASTLRLAGQESVALLDKCNFFIVTVPTPIDADHNPDLGPVRSACRLIGPYLRRGAVVVFESTVYPGVTENICGPLLEEVSGLVRGTDFHLGYSPERINPGDREHRLESIVKVIAAEDEATLARLRTVYGAIVMAGLHEAPTIKVAEAAKVIENTQRDLNIALMNELAVILDRMDVRTADVLAAAGTKWNFLRFSPGLVGGHCIGVDPYYLTHASEALGYKPQVILAGRRINNGMSAFVAGKTLELMNAPVGEKAPLARRVGVLGLTFKENVPDLRNSKVPDLIAELRRNGADVVVHDAMADPAEATEEYGIELVNADNFGTLDAVIVAVPHAAYGSLAYRLIETSGARVVVDIRSILDRARLPEGIVYWSL
ncbi:nucleotide sugar dehydrogenase [Sphingomonas oligophenolica]|uniref:Nucleotide sugar dehydrogenase n=1 Tax=Sphingomonas oligophenolica TaxID=301154 RepID=A0A502C828_9SPHN|nr:nucleotide sugar dehydrogenase [Sphingomonas oligophenolica]TPG08129.1 nucleotide sugar dehydrogenase [Sphingomonas oligophenolica]